MIKYEYNSWQFSEFEREDGHMIINVSILNDDNKISKIKLIFDSGAYVTVISKPTARKLGLPIGSGKPAFLRGFNREHTVVTGELIEIPKIMIGKHFVSDVKAVIPLDDIPVAEVLGENLLEYMNYTVDHDKDKIYFEKNPNPKPYINEEKGIDLSCGGVLLHSIDQ